MRYFNAAGAHDDPVSSVRACVVSDLLIVVNDILRVAYGIDGFVFFMDRTIPPGFHPHQ